MPAWKWSGVRTRKTRKRTNALRLAHKLGFDDYASLVRFSAEEPERFWPAAIEDMGLEFSRPWDAVVDESRGPEWATWFVGGRLNLAWNCVHRWARGERAEEPAAVWQSEDGQRRSLSYRELSAEVTRLAEALARLGVEPGDRVAIFLPMSPEVAIASHACAHLGAIQMPVFSGFAAPAIASRLQHAEAKVVITADGSLRRGREVPMKALVDEALEESPSVEHVVVWRRLGGEVPMRAGRDVFWDEAVAESPGELEPLEVDSEHPYLLTYTSGTTGPPKGVLHVQGGFLVSITREVAYQADAKPGDVIHFVTDMGWIMGPWEVVGGMALGCTIVFAEGAPDWPAADRLWGLVESERVSILGLSPTLVRALIPHGAELVERHDLSSLRVLVDDRRAVEPGAVPLALRARRRRPLPDHQLLGRHRGRRLLPLAHPRGADQVVLARRACAGDGDGRRRRGRALGARRGRRARLPAGRSPA